MPSRRRIATFAVASLWLTLGGCQYLTDTAGAQEVAKRMFESRRAHNQEAAMAQYSPQFFAATPAPKWVAMLDGVQTRLGELEAFELAQWNVRTNIGTNGGTFYQLIYRVKYARYSATEAVTLYKPFWGGDMRIVAHHINSEGLLLQ
jgi:hypothetical protein